MNPPRHSSNEASSSEGWGAASCNLLEVKTPGRPLPTAMLAPTPGCEHPKTEQRGGSVARGPQIKPWTASLGDGSALGWGHPGGCDALMIGDPHGEGAPRRRAAAGGRGRAALGAACPPGPAEGGTGALPGRAAPAAAAAAGRGGGQGRNRPGASPPGGGGAAPPGVHLARGERGRMEQPGRAARLASAPRPAP